MLMKVTPHDLCSLSYITVNDAAEAVTRMGRGSLLAKVDIKNVYRMVEVHPEDRSLLGMQFEGRLFVNSVLPFGLRSAPKIFTAVADALEWIVRRAGLETLLHYLDDFLVVARPASSQCQDNLRVLLEIFSHLHVPVAEDKLEGPATSLTFLGIELDTEQMVLRLPPEKLIELRTLLSQWHSRRYCRTRELKSLVGKLQHASKVIRPGRTFFRPPKRDKTASTPAPPECRISLRPRLVAHLPRILARGLDVSPVPRRHTRPPPLYGCGWCGRVWSLVRISLVPVLVA